MYNLLPASPLHRTVVFWRQFVEEHFVELRRKEKGKSWVCMCSEDVNKLFAEKTSRHLAKLKGNTHELRWHVPRSRLLWKSAILVILHMSRAPFPQSQDFWASLHFDLISRTDCKFCDVVGEGKEKQIRKSGIKKLCKGKKVENFSNPSRRTSGKENPQKVF